MSRDTAPEPRDARRYQLVSVDRLVPVRPILPQILTPFGIVSFGAKLGDGVLPECPSVMFRLPSGGHLARWRKDTATVDLLFGSVQPARWDNYPSVTQQWTALWQVVAARDLSTLTLSMELVNPPRDAHAGWDTGQSEAAITVYSSAGQISLGGPDTEWLHSIAAVGEGLPARWAKLLDEYSDSYDSTFRVEYTGVGTLTWHLPNMKQAEFAQLCLSLAWVSPPNDDVCTTVSLTSSAAAAMEELLAPKRPQRSLANDVTSGEL